MYRIHRYGEDSLMYRKKHTTKRKILIGNKGKVILNETRIKLSNSRKERI